MTNETYKDEYGVVHPKGPKERVDLITNPLAIINRTIPMVLYEGSITCIIDKARKYAATLDSLEEKKDFLFDIIRILNPIQANDLEVIYNKLSDKKKQKFIDSCISINRDGTLMTNKGIYIRWEAFNDQWKLRDSIIEIHKKYGDVIQPYNIFMPKPKWGRDIFVGQDYIGYQYIMMLKQSGEKGFSVRSAGAISDESLPEKSHSAKLGKDWKSTKPINVKLVGVKLL